MNVSSWLQQAKKRIDSLDAELILLNALGEKDRSFLVAQGDRNFEARLQFRLEEAVRRREKGEPLAYILGRKEFFGRDFIVNRWTLIPRPETEEMIWQVKNLALGTNTRILEVGTSSGCVAITLALEIPGAQVVATDICKRALSVAKNNAEQLGAKVQFLQADLLDGVEGKFDVVVANLPYVDESWGWLDQKALSFEPRKALFVKDEGLFLIKKLLKEVQERKITQHVILEADPVQHEAIVQFAEKLGFKKLAISGFVVSFKRED